MKKTFLKVAIALSFVFTNTFAQQKDYSTMVLEGQYNGKNILVKNPWGAGGVGFCIVETKVNGTITTDEINNSTFSISLDEVALKLGLKLGEKVKVEIKYKKGCSAPMPMIMNPGALESPEGNKESVLVLEGKFQYSNLFICNPRVAGSKDYGIKEILVNGKALESKINSDVFEINLTSLGALEAFEEGKKVEGKLNDGDKIKIEIKYLKGYDPTIINPEAIN